VRFGVRRVDRAKACPNAQFHAPHHGAGTAVRDSVAGRAASPCRVFTTGSEARRGNARFTLPRRSALWHNGFNFSRTPEKLQ